MHARWVSLLRWVDGVYFIWRGIHKWRVPATIWLIPRVSRALPTTPLAVPIRALVFPHAETIGLALGGVEVVAGLGLLALPRQRIFPAVLALLNLLFLLTLGFQEPHDLALNVLMGILNAYFALSPKPQTGRRWSG